MKVKAIVVVFLWTFVSVSSTKTCFRAATYEAIHLGSDRVIDPDDLYRYVAWNLESYSTAAKKAREEGVDILVLPENSLVSPQSSLKGSPQLSSRHVIKMFAENLPDPTMTSQPCSQHKFNDKPMLKRFSCIAKENNLYLITTLPTLTKCSSGLDGCPTDGFFIYNTQVVFDRQGNLIARYHKFHLYGEPYFNMPTQQELSFFDTDFGARIGLFICFDRIFKDPMISLTEKYNVTTMALSTRFFDGYPFMLSHQIDQAWSQKLRINIITSNHKNPGLGTTGSGIFSPDKVAIYEHDSIDVKTRVKSVLLVANLPVDPKSRDYCDPKSKRMEIAHDVSHVIPGAQTYHFIENKLEGGFQIINDFADDVTTCSKGLCCRLEYSKANLGRTGVVYIFVVTSRMKTFQSGHQACEESCMLVAYDVKRQQFLEETDVQFSQIKISSSSFSTPYVFSSALENNYRLIAQNDIIYGTQSLQILNYSRPVLFAGMYGRCFDKDPPYVQIPSRH